MKHMNKPISFICKIVYIYYIASVHKLSCIHNNIAIMKPNIYIITPY